MAGILLTVACGIAGIICDEPPPVGEMPILAVAYDPLHAWLDPSACDYECEHFANNELVTAEHYDNTAACILDWHTLTISVPELGEFVCRDTGALVQIAYNEYYDKWVIYLDVMHDLEADPDPWFNYRLFYGWQTR